ncbi:hypothetical protein B0H13DRAFT_1854710 [Mycena leptocephala]|nr:hypothetical protein B0H13DRAFT_1854710 [Mycena leptocephala]
MRQQWPLSPTSSAIGWWMYQMSVGPGIVVQEGKGSSKRRRGKRAPVPMPFGHYAVPRADVLQIPVDPRCLKVRTDAEKISNSDSDEDEALETEIAGNFPTGGGSFAGDFFRSNYSEQDFNYASDEDNDTDPEPESDEEEDPAARDHAAAADAQAAEGWEPHRPHNDPEENSAMEDATALIAPVACENRKIAEDRFHETPVVVRYPSNRAGEEISERPSASAEEQYSDVLGKFSNIYAPFNPKMDWEVAKWAKLRGSGSTAFTDFLKIQGVADALGISYRSSAELNTIIDEKLPGRPKFTRSEIVVAGEAFDLYSLNIIECVRALFGDTDFAPYLFVKQVEGDNPGATTIPILLSSDKTQLTMFGNKIAYPVYMTIGNIPKEIRRKPSRRAYVLLAYLPTLRLSHIKNKAARRRTLANLFHACLTFITAPLQTAGIMGIPITSGDGKLRRGHPIVACYISDYPEQLLVACVKTGLCPTGQVDHESLGDGDQKCAPRDLAKVLEALETLDAGGTVYTQSCTDAGIKPVVHPFWEKFPYTNIFLSITSDVLHQLYQGIIKHLIEWLKECLGEVELDARCRRLPPNHNIRLFMKGISHLNRVTASTGSRGSNSPVGTDLCEPHCVRPAPIVILQYVHKVTKNRSQFNSTSTMKLSYITSRDGGDRDVFHKYFGPGTVYFEDGTASDG